MTEFVLEMFEAQLQQTASAIKNLGGEVKAFQLECPATQNEVDEAEERLGVKLPCSFKRVLMKLSRAAYIEWFLPDDVSLPAQFKQIFSGHIHWSLERLPDIDEARKDWVRECFPDLNDPYDQRWHNKLAFYEVGNGDQLAFDLAAESHGAIVYLSHDGGEGHGLKLANSFEELLQNWSLLGCVGGEDWQWLPFYDHDKAAIDPRSETAAKFRKALGLEFLVSAAR